MVRWTFDPLVRRNAHFNLHKLGATASEYLPDFYGPMDDGINTGDASDRLMADWQLTSARAVGAAHGACVDADEVVRGARVTTLLDRVDGKPLRRGYPAPGQRDGRVSPLAPPRVADAGPGRVLLVALPMDIETLRVSDRRLADRWRHEVRAALTGALDRGYRIVGVTRHGCYVLVREPEEVPADATDRP